MTSKLTRERLEKIKSWRETYGAGSNVMLPAEEAEELACLALAAMDSEPVVWRVRFKLEGQPGSNFNKFFENRKAMDDVVSLHELGGFNIDVTPLYRHVQPAPVVQKTAHSSVIAEQLANVLSEMKVTDHQRAVISCAVDRLNNVAQLLQLSPSALLVPEILDYQGAKELYNYLMTEEEINATVNAWNACRAAMLAAAQHDTPALNSIQSVDTVADRWIPVSERIPDNTEPVLCIEKRADFGTYGQPFVCWHDGGGWVGKTNYRPIVTHWMPLPAGPQEVR
ncbi:TPA: DUF551 domain-containing protein [Klebsiella pneumoniae]